MAFQTSVSSQPSPGVEGGFYGANPYYTLTHPDEGMWVAGASGPFIGSFAWCNTANGQATSNNPGVSTVRLGYVHRDQAVVIAALLLSNSNQVISGQGLDLLDDGSVWSRFAGGAAIGNKVYASYADGSVYAAATATPATVTRSVTTTNASTAITYTGGAIFAGQPISGTGIPANAYVVSVNAVAGTAVISVAATASGTVTGTFTTNLETSFTVRSTAAAGELAKMSVRG
jgi:hypothetical protein